MSNVPVDSVGSVSYQCTTQGELGAGQLLPITIDLGKGSSGSYTSRSLYRSSEALNYNLYLDAARTTIWGDGTGSTSRFSANLQTTSGTIPIYSRVPARQDISAGSYTDTPTVTINF